MGGTHDRPVDEERDVEAGRSEEPELVFLDVQMPGMTGLEVLAALSPDPIPAVVFVTAYEAHAVQAFELHAIDYLLKPFEDRRFDEALRRARARVENRRLLSDFAERVAALLQDAGKPMGSVLPDRAAAASEAPLEWLVVKEAERSVLPSSGNARQSRTIAGVGTDENPEAIEKYSPGAFLYFPPEQPHYGGAEGETVIQLHGEAPFEIMLANTGT